ncbi:uncharacterized protein LOC108221022 isoform X2 [Daucus carota subsp. sativus]|uniref:uncharacterized protein LOC108221022 isoform X2 n=1 Tax=Daucus carota subsp. sativus TaxID=79200 RepID=UPI0030833B53
MTDNINFNGEPFLCQDHNLSDNIIMASDNYVIDGTDPHLVNLYHGKLYDIIGQEETARKVSFLIFQYTHAASRMRRWLGSLSALAPLNVARTYCVSPVKALISRPYMYIGSVQIRIQATQRVVDKPCLIIDQVSAQTFDAWNSSALNEEDLTLFFRSLFSAVSMFHQDGKYFGNIRAGIRISGNLPTLAFPAVFEAIQCEQGIRNDLKELHKMVLESKVSGACERKLFDELCQKYVGNHGSSAFLSDTLEQAIPIDFWTRIQTATPSSSASKLQRLYYHDNADTRTYLSTESIRHFHRCGYEHKTPGYPSNLDMEKLLYSVFPEAPAFLYEMMINKLYVRGHMMPSIINFLQIGPYKFNF